MAGGSGNDTYVVDVATDVVVELAGEGTDSVRTTLTTFNLNTAALTNVENLTYTGTVAFTGTGNALANALTGSVGNDALDGGAGDDTLAGGAGNDTYTVDSAGDVVVELAGQGTDTIRTTLAFLSLGAEVENLTYTGAAAFTGAGNTIANILTGGALADTLSGNEGNDTLNGAAGNDTLNGGTGNDSMAGGIGDDTYLVDSVADVIVEGTASGTDSVRTALASFSLNTAAMASVENLVYTGVTTFSGIGNVLANTLLGGVGNDTLDGGAGNDTLDGGAGNDSLNGGAGVDTLTGGADSDRFVFSALTDSGLTAVLRDVISDFVVGADTIDLSAIDGNNTLAGDQAFSWRGTAPINGAGQLSMAYDSLSNTTIISGNIDNNLAADFTLALVGNYTATMVQTDFVL
jgi:serralysin